MKNQKNCNEAKKKLMNKEHRLRLKKELEKKLLEECRLKEEAEAKKMETVKYHPIKLENISKQS